MPVVATRLSKGNTPPPAIAIGAAQSSFVGGTGGTKSATVNVAEYVTPSVKAPS